MLKRSLVFVFLSGLLILMGCQQTTDSGSTILAGRHSVYGSTTPEKLQEAANNARAAGEPLIFAPEGTTITAGPALIDLTGIAVRIEGPVTTSGTGAADRVILDASRAASLTLIGDDASLEGVTAFDFIIYAAGMDLKDIRNTQKVLYTPDLADITGTVSAVAVDEFVVDADFNTTAFPAGVDNLFVLKKVSVLPAATTALTGTKNLYALGDVELKGNSSTVLAATTFVFTSSARIINGTNGPVTAAVGATFSIAEIDVGGPTTGITLTGPTSLTLGKLNGKDGPLSVPATTVAITINGGDGDIVIGNGAASDITFTGDVINKSTGKTTFNTNANNAVKFPDAGVGITGGADIAGDVEFKGTAATGATDGDLKFGGKVILADAKTITLTKDASNLILDSGATIYVGDTPLLTALSETTFDPAEDAVILGVTATGSILTLTKDLTTLTGNVKLLPDAVLVLAAATDLPLAANSSIVLDAVPASTTPAAAARPSVLRFANASTSRLILGGATITGGNAANALTAGDAPVTLTQNAIAGESGAKLASGGNTAALAITIAAAGPSLTLDGVNLDLQSFGSLVLTNGTANAGVVLKGGSNPGKITLGNATTPITWATNVASKYIFDSANGAQITGTGGIAVGSADSATATISSISGGDLTPDNDVKITQKTGANVTINATAALSATP